MVGQQGRILWHGAFADLPREHAGAPRERYDDAVILPGLIDAHVHFPQHRMLAAPAHDLLEWLDRFAFPEEARYASEDHCRGRRGELPRQAREPRHHRRPRLLVRARASGRLLCSGRRSGAASA